MEMWERVTVVEQAAPPSRHRRSSPSFSSSLLDSIYRSIDGGLQSSGNPTAGNPTPCTLTRLSCNYSDSAKLARPAPILTRCNPTRPEPPTQPDPNPARNQNQVKKKLRDLKKKKKSGSPFSSSSSSSSSPGAKLAGFLNSLFTAASSQKKPKFSPSPSPPSTSRSCLVKTPSSSRGSSIGSARSTRSVRFCPVGVIVGEDCRPCGEKLVVLDDDDNGEVMARERRRRRRMVMEEVILRGFEMESESDDDSEDLFELRDLGCTDELPVYGTTDLGINSGGLLL